MKTNVWKIALLSTSLLLIAPVICADNWQPIDRYQVKDGLVKDVKAGLMWMRCSVGQKWDGSRCQGEANRYTWEKVMQTPTHFSFAGYKDWRVPSHNELKSLVNCSSGQVNRLDKWHNQCGGDYASPTISQTAFPQTPDSWFWSSSLPMEDWFGAFPFTYFGHYAWIVNFNNGLDITSHRDDSGHLRLVRTGK
ncbi:DUF1566 domain-containing protein [Crenothrix polyspora]|uniref:Lipoprotein n=1 Tax=Crenothrix polyspora TaxID=360316 RepID=A0A1R4H2C6_9GAMM|nr:DUF1566 domain-containing protein [Crenothrix polyspora]SJM90391.1 Lipoprotein [Crenothrix polyspora]